MRAFLPLSQTPARWTITQVCPSLLLLGRLAAIPMDQRSFRRTGQPEPMAGGFMSNLLLRKGF
jgi:hypothetical protein